MKYKIKADNWGSVLSFLKFIEIQSIRIEVDDQKLPVYIVINTHLCFEELYNLISQHDEIKHMANSIGIFPDLPKILEAILEENERVMCQFRKNKITITSGLSVNDIKDKMLKQNIKNYQDPNQDKHEQLIDLMNSFGEYKDGSLKHKKRSKYLKSKDLNKLDINEINQGAIVLVHYFHLCGGSVGTIDMYKLLQTYFLDLEKREQINKIIKSF